VARVSGSGESFGGAFRDAMRQVSLGAPRASYTRTTTIGQFRQMFETNRGYAAMSAAGLNVKQARTIQGWLEGTSSPNKANSEAIHRAYASLREGGIPAWVKQGTMSITGRVAYGDDVRDRGSGGQAPLHVDLSAGNWAPVQAALDDDEIDDDDLAELVAEELIAEDIGEAYEWGFPGGAYSVVVAG
jgi:hypothetical protein